MKETISQTLFRFVSLRNPDISTAHEQEKRFISPSENAKTSVFYTAINEKDADVSKKEALQDAAIEFRALSKEELKKVDAKLYEFSEWLITNRVNYKQEDLKAKMEGLSPLNDDAFLWDNLFYQMITEKDFYAKETAIHMLKANHVIANYPVGEVLSTEEVKAIEKTLIYATVLLPNELFSNSNEFDSTAKKTSESFKTYPLTEGLRASIASESLQELQTIKEEIDELDTAYQEAYQIEYQEAKNTHEQQVQGIVQKYENDMQAAKANWCTTRGDTPYDANNINPCDQPDTVPYPTLPDFTFSFTAEIDPKNVQTEMSAETYAFVNTLKPIDKISSYAEIKSLLAKEEDKLNVELYQNTPFHKKSISVNGAIFPVSKTANKQLDAAYRGGFCSKARKDIKKGTWSWKFYADIESANDSIAPISNVTTKVSKIDGTLLTESTSFSVIASGSDLVKINLLAVVGDTAETSLRLESTVTFLDGASLTFNGVLRPNTCGQATSSSTTTDPAVTADEQFIPSGYGMRQLGIADYRKVEQSVHCYQEGEVSHIENVMAREYKEKATRRLRINENTTSSSSETEKEQLTDTTTTNRYEMQNEVSQVLSEAQDFSANTSFNMGRNGDLYFNVGAGTNFATHTSSEDSTNQAMTEAQEITERAMDRVVQRVKEERITKIIEEYEENNKHGFDNRKGDKHVVGVYRWVDKVYKNQIYNYGRRLMYEFAIPQPSKLHRLAMTEIGDGNTDSIELSEPIDPRTLVIGGQTIADASMITATNYKKLAAKYNAEVTEPPVEEMYVGHAFSYQAAEVISNNHERFGEDVNYELPEGYYTYKAKANWADSIDGPSNSTKIIVGGVLMTNKNVEKDVAKHVGHIPISFSSHQHLSGNSNISIRLQVLPEFIEKWQNETFTAILTAYEDQMAEYLAQKSQEVVKEAELRGSNPMFYRQIEQTVLRKNCLSYLMDQAPTATKTYGKQFYTGDALENHEVTVTKSMDDYASFAKFMEQAFEWEIMSYSFYPFYWANRKEWNDLYSYENNDPLFRSFMQAGLARVVLTVRPGFEEAVLHYMSTGSIWNGGELPVLDDPLYRSIVDELKKPLGVKEGKAWKTKVPTSLTILQADSLGLQVEKALPCECDDIEDFIESDQTECSSQILNDPTVFKDLQVGDGDTTATTTN